MKQGQKCCYVNLWQMEHWLPRGAIGTEHIGCLKRMNEPKGDHLENTESKHKVKIGRVWEKLVGSNYRYYMVFRDKDLKVDGAVKFERFLEIVRGL